MPNKIYTIFDRVAEQAGPLFEAPNDGVAMRAFRNTLERTPSYQLGDYRLYRLGTFDPEAMKMEIYGSIDEVMISKEE